MPSDLKQTTSSKRIAAIFEPHPNLKDGSTQRKARLTLLTSGILTAACLLAFLIVLLLGLGPGAVLVFLFLALLFAAALVVGRTENLQASGTILVAALLIAGFTLSAVFPEGSAAFLLSAIVPALTLGLVLLPVVTLIILSLLNLLSLAVMPIMDEATGVFLFISLLIIEPAFIVVAIIQNRIDEHRLDELNSLRGSLDERLPERTRSTRIHSGIAEEIALAPTTEELLRQTADLLVGRMGFAFAGIYLTDEQARTSSLKAAQGLDAESRLAAARPIPHGPPHPVGWVAENRRLHIQSRSAEDELQLETDFLGDCQGAIYLPIMARDRLLGVLSAQSTRATAFDNETLDELATLAQQIATAITNVRLVESEQGDIKEIADIYRAGFPIARAGNHSEVARAIEEVLQSSSYISLYLVADGPSLSVVSRSVAPLDPGVSVPNTINVSIEELQPALSGGIFFGEGGRLNSLPYNLLRVLRQLNIFSVAIIPILDRGAITAVILIGTMETAPLSEINVQPYINVAELVSNANDRIREARNTERRIIELETLTQVSQELSSVWDIKTLYRTLHTRIRQALGDVNFVVNLYDSASNSLSTPYLYDRSTRVEETATTENRPLEEDLTAILIRSRQPLMLVEDASARAAEMGAKVIGRNLKSWLGAPMIISGEVIGAIAVEDPTNEHAFDDTDMRFLTTLSAQVAGAIFNLRLLAETRDRAVQLQTASEIARDISGSLDIGELLAEAVSLIRERFDFYHAAIFLVDPMGEFAMLREATGEAGAELKRVSHKLKVGSKSIVGYVTGSGEPLVVNDTSRDATYYANPLLPETRSETAIPLRVGSRILGALDVQSTQPFAFTEDRTSVLRILADQLAVAIINSELFAETQEHLSQDRLLHHVTTAAASGTTLEEALSSAAQGLQVTLGGDHVSILLGDKERQVLQVKAIAGYSEEVQELEVPYGKGITGWVAVNQQPLRINDVSQDPRYIQAGSNVKSELAIPLTYRGELLGVLNVESDQVAAYTENDEEMLGTLGGSLAAIIANARLVEQVRRQVERERLLYEVTSKIRRSTDMQTIMATTATELTKALGTRRAKIKIDISDATDDLSQ